MTGGIVPEVVIGAGFYGLRVALFLRERLGVPEVLVLEQADRAMTRASRVNQARVHLGYHYPRSVLTGYRSRVNYPTFAAEFDDAIVRGFRHYYGVATQLTKTSARQFELFCRRIGAPVAPAPPEIAGLFDEARMEAVFEVEEPAFDTGVLREILLDRVARTGGIELRLGTGVERLESADGAIDVHHAGGVLRARRVTSTVYSGLNRLHAASGIPLVGLQHEVTELALVEMPPPLRDAAVTVMDGPFFSVMPFPSVGLHSLSHVRYTVHHRWTERAGQAVDDPYSLLRAVEPESAFPSMRADVRRFVPGLEMRHADSLFEVKTVLTRSSDDDSRPILFQTDQGMSGYTCIMGSKLDNVYDVLEELRRSRER